MDGILRFVGLYPSVKEEERREQLRLNSMARELSYERAQIARDQASVLASLEAAMKAGNDVAAQGLSRTLVRLQALDTRKSREQSDLMLLKYEVSNIASVGQKQKVLAGMGKLAKRQTGALKVASIEKKQREVLKDVQRLQEGRAAVEEAMSGLVAEDVTGDSGMDESAEAQLVMDKMRDKLALAGMMRMPDPPSARPSAAVGRVYANNDDSVLVQVAAELRSGGGGGDSAKK